MTVVAIWQEDGFLWSVADTRISAPGNSGGRVISTDTGSKLFSLPISCSQLISGQMRRAPHYWTTVGFAFAGATLPATMTYATASTFLQNLLTTGSRNPPRLSDVAECVRGIGERFAREALNASNGISGGFECSIFGWEPYLNAFAIYHMVGEDAGATLSVREVFPAEQSIVVMGNGAQRLLDRIAAIRSSGDDRTPRVPKIAAASLVEQDEADIGGSLSIGVAVPPSPDGAIAAFRLLSWVRPIQKGNPEAYESFNGIELNERNRKVGSYFVGVDGIV